MIWPSQAAVLWKQLVAAHLEQEGQRGPGLWVLPTNWPVLKDFQPLVRRRPGGASQGRQSHFPSGPLAKDTLSTPLFLF